MNAVFLVLAFQVVLGGFDNLWHHELQARLPHTPGARRELSLHAAREAIYAVVFAGLAWFEWHGAAAWALAGLLAVEVVITLADFLEEDRTRRLPPLERLLHTVLTLSYGVFVALLAPVLAGWARLEPGLVRVSHGGVSWALSAASAGVPGRSYVKDFMRGSRRLR